MRWSVSTQYMFLGKVFRVVIICGETAYWAFS